MLLDFNDLEEGVILESDICIVGAGAAGIAMGREFAKTSLRVCILESGGLNYEQETQDLYQGVDENLPVQPGISRLRFFGGTTNHWEGQCTPLTALDFQKRAWVADSGWPINYGDVLPYYQKAQEICGLGHFEYGEALWSLLSEKPPAFDKEKLETFFLQLTPGSARLFGQARREEAQSWPNVNVYLHANVINIETTGGNNHVSGLEVASLNGKKGKVTARRYILAAGAIANARIMLYSNKVSANGIGNEYDNVGRYFMQHPHVDIAEIVTEEATAKNALSALIGGKNLPEEGYNRVVAQVGVRLSPQQQEKEKVLNSSLLCRKGVPFDSPEQLLVSMLKRLKRGQIPDRFLEKLWYLTKNAGELAEFIPLAFKEGVEPALKKTSNGKTILVQARMEQSPNRESRLLLSDKRDALGLPGLRTQWRLNELDRYSIKLMASKLGAEIGRLGLGRLRFAEWFDSFDPQDDSPGNWHPSMWGGFHHMGSTRMSDTPHNGVVDRNCRVHSIDNLYIAGSSVFASSGYANPTLTLLALAYRLVDHLKELD